MKKTKAKKIITLIMASLMIASVMPVFNAAAEVTGVDVTTIIAPPTVPEITRGLDYTFIGGTIKEINDFIGVDGEPVKDKYIVGIENGESVWNAIIDSNTYYINLGETDEKAMSVGDSIKVFYDANAPWLMIYPPQVNAEFIALNFDEVRFITIARFDGNFTNLKHSLKLNISENTEIVYEDGVEFTGEPEELINRKLIVIYSVTTRSIPAITTPEKIIVMYEKAVPPIYILTDEEKAEYMKSFENADIVVNGKVIDSPKAYMNEDLILIVPVRAVAEALGYEVQWFEDTQSVQAGKNLFFTIGKDEYSFARMVPVPLGAAPVLKGDRTFAPIDMFNLPTFEASNINWYLADGQLHIQSVSNETDK